MSIDDTYGRTDSPTPLGGTSQTGTATGRSAEYGDGLTGNETATQNSSFGERGNSGETLTSDETGRLISADKVQGTAVYEANGDRLGTIDSIMIDKVSGKVAYAVMSFGGFLGIGERYHPLPWNALTYDEAKGGYNVAQSASDLRGAPNYSRDEVATFDYGTRGNEIDDYYGVDTARGTSGLKSGDAVGSTIGGGSSGMAATGMGANRNF